MAVYVDQMMACLPNKRWKWNRACHLVADSETELVAFAVGLGLKKQWIQRGTLTHFDLTEGKREQALRMGAVELSRWEMVERIRAARAAPERASTPEIRTGLFGDVGGVEYR